MRLVALMLGCLLFAGCVGPAAPEEPEALTPPVSRARVVDGVAAAGAVDGAASATATAACPVSTDKLDQFPEGFQTLRKEAVPGPAPDHATTIYEECDTAFRWATTRISSEGLTLRMTVDVPDETTCLAYFLVAGTQSVPGPLSLTAAEAEYGTGWGMGSTGPMARVHVLDADSNDVLHGTGGKWAGGGGTGVSGGTWSLTFAAQGIEGWENDFTGGWAAILVLACQGPFQVTDIRGAWNANLHDQNTLAGGLGVHTWEGGFSIQDAAEAVLGEGALVLSGAFSGQAWRLVLEHPDGTETAMVGPADQGMYKFEGKPGTYKVTLDKVDGPIFSAWWLLMASGDAQESMATFF